MNTTNPTTRARNRYSLEFTLAMGAYVAVLFASIALLRHGVSPLWQWPVALLPMLPIAGILVAVARFIAGSDEFIRQTLVTSLAIAGGITAMFVLTSGFLENAGFARPSMWTIWVVYAVSWGIATPLVRRYYS